MALEPAHRPVTFLGLKNYQDVLADPTFQRAIQNSIYYAVVWVPLTMAIGLFLAVVVNQKIRGRTFFRASFYFPAIASSAAITTLWIFIVSPDRPVQRHPGRAAARHPRRVVRVPAEPELDPRPGHGAQLGHHPQRLDDVGHVHAVLPGLAPVDQQRVYEAAAIDGAGAWQTFRRITFPLLRPGHYFVATVAVIGALQLFDQAIFGGGVNGDPNNALMTMVLYLYNQAFKQFNFSMAAAVGVILFVADLLGDARPAAAVRPGSRLVRTGR